MDSNNLVDRLKTVQNYQKITEKENDDLDVDDCILRTSNLGDEFLRSDHLLLGSLNFKAENLSNFSDTQLSSPDNQPSSIVSLENGNRTNSTHNDNKKEKKYSSLRKVDKFFLSFISKISERAKAYLEKRENENLIVQQQKMLPHLITSAKKVEDHSGFKLTNESPEKLMTVDENLFLSPQEFDHKGEYHIAVAKSAVEGKLHEKVREKVIPKLGKLTPYSFEAPKKLEKQFVIDPQKTTTEQEVVKRVANVPSEIKFNQGISPTSYALGINDEIKKGHLTNVYVLDVGGEKVVIRSGVIDNEQKANDFISLLTKIRQDFINKKKEDNSNFNSENFKLRVVSQQLNSFEKESKMIDSQHRWIAHVNKELGDKAEVIHINIPSNRWYHTTKSFQSNIFGRFIMAIAPKKYFQGEKLSKDLNLDSLGIYVNWTEQYLSSFDIDKTIREPLKEHGQTYNDSKKKIDGLVVKIHENEKLLRGKNISNEKKTELKNTLIKDKEALKEERKLMKEKLIESHKILKQLEELIVKKQDLSEDKQDLSEDNVKCLQIVSLTRQMLGSQLGIKREVLDRGQEGMVLQMLNDKLGVVSALNCKSGLDRTGIWHAVKLAMLSFDKTEGMTPWRSFALVNEWEKTTSLMNKMSARLKGKDLASWMDNNLILYQDWKKQFGELVPEESKFKEFKEKIQDVLAFRKEVLKNLITIGIPITTASTGLMGLKWNSGIQENLVPLNFLPSHVITKVKTQDWKGSVKIEEKPVSLLRYNRRGEVLGISTWGKRLITKFQKLRGS